MTSYLLIVNGTECINGKWKPALAMAQRRLLAGKWPLYKNTPHRNDMKTGDQVIVYLAGKDNEAKHFVATAIIGKIGAPYRYDADGSDVLTEPPVVVLSLETVEWLCPPVPIGAIKNNLDFIPKGTNRWGCVLQRGAKRVSEEDTNRILSWQSSDDSVFLRKVFLTSFPLNKRK